jgi:hypothetical protein
VTKAAPETGSGSEPHCPWQLTSGRSEAPFPLPARPCSPLPNFRQMQPQLQPHEVPVPAPPLATAHTGRHRSSCFTRFPFSSRVVSLSPRPLPPRGPRPVAGPSHTNITPHPHPPTHHPRSKSDMENRNDQPTNGILNAEPDVGASPRERFRPWARRATSEPRPASFRGSWPCASTSVRPPPQCASPCHKTCTLPAPASG